MGERKDGLQDLGQVTCSFCAVVLPIYKVGIVLPCLVELCADKSMNRHEDLRCYGEAGHIERQESGLNKQHCK